MKIDAISNIKNITFQKKLKNTNNGRAPERSNNLSLRLGILAPKYQRRYERLLKGMSASGLEMAKLAEKFAREFVIYKDPRTKTAQITKEHCYLAYLYTLLDYALEIKNDNLDYVKDTTDAAQYAARYSTEWIWTKENIDRTIKLFQEELKKVQNELKEKSVHNGFVTSVMIDESFMKDIEELAAIAMSDNGDYDIANIQANDAFFISTIHSSSNMQTHAFGNKIDSFFHKLSIGATTDEYSDKAVAIPYYRDLAQKVIKNADRNYNMFVTYSEEDESAPEYFINTLVHELENFDDSDFKNIKKDKIKTIIFNEHANMGTIAEECKSLAKDTGTQYFIIVKDINRVFFSSVVQTGGGAPGISYAKIRDSIGTKAKNIHFVLLNNQDDYYRLIKEPVIEKSVRDYQNMQLPMMDVSALKNQVLLTKDFIKSQIDTDIDDEALEYIAALPLNSKGSGYDNVIRFIKNISAYYVDTKVITKNLAQSYWENTQKSDMATDDSPYDIIFDTNRGLDSIIGTPMVKKQVQNIVFELKNFPKTKGYIIHYAGNNIGGRLNCAKAIAGELKIPMICINASDFAIRDLDTINMDPMKAIEAKMNKLINVLKTQAQANANKTVMLYISEFDHFASDPVYGLSSIYEQQAFQKILREMKKSQNDPGYNIVVMGASDYPEATKEDIIRPGLFMDDITIYPPTTPNNIREIALKYIEKQGYELENENTMNHFVKLMNGSGADYIDTVYLLDKAFILSRKRGADKIEIADLNEAYLSRTAGEVSEDIKTDRHKEAVIRHEGGHAVNLQFMYNLLKEQGDNLKIGDSIVNIVLDPRGWYGGCVYPAQSYENTGETNMETIMSDLICDFGGNSSEEYFYGMDGSWGISQDRKNANYMAKMAVLYMGLGARMKHYIPDVDPETGLPILNSSDEENYVKDVKTLLENAKIASDKIVRCYEDFLIEFSSKYISKYGTGDCVVTGEDFALMLKEWEERQPQKKKQEIAKLKKEVLAIIEYTKKGVIYSKANSINPIYRLF